MRMTLEKEAGNYFIVALLGAGRERKYFMEGRNLVFIIFYEKVLPRGLQCVTDCCDRLRCWCTGSIWHPTNLGHTYVTSEPLWVETITSYTVLLAEPVPSRVHMQCVKETTKPKPKLLTFIRFSNCVVAFLPSSVGTSLVASEQMRKNKYGDK